MSNNGQWENKSQEEIDRDRYRFTGERYGMRGTAHELGDDIIPQSKGLFAYPAMDTEEPEKE